MSRVSIAILILIIIGFIMTIQRDGPAVISGDPSVTVATADNDKKGEQNPARKSKAVKNNITDATSSISKSTVATKQISNESSSKSENNDNLEGGEYLGLQVHRELARLGCFTGNVKNRWGRTSRAAVTRFNRVSKFSWPDWPSRDLVKSLRNYPDAYCKKCRGGGEGCEIANTNAPTDETTKPASPSTPEAVTFVPPHLPFGAAKSAAKEASAREQAARERAVREKAKREAAAREQAAREQAAREAAAREAAARERAERERAAKEAAAKERAAREQAAREKAAREAAEREQAAKEAARKAAEAKKAAEKAVAAQKAAEEEAAAKEAAAKEAAAKAAAAREAVDNAAPQAEPDEGDKQKRSVASVDPVDTGENTEEAKDTNDADIENDTNDATDAPSYLPPGELHREPRVDEPRQRSTKRRASSKRRKKDETSTRVKRRRRSDARRRRRREYQEDTASYPRHRPRQPVWQGEWKPRQSGVGR